MKNNDLLAQRVVNMRESATLAMARLSRKLREQGYDVITLSLGEPDFNTPEFIKEAAKKAIDDNYSHYTPECGYDDLRQAISKKLKRDNNLDFSAEQIIVSNGAKQSIANLLLSIINKGDEVIVPVPYWVSYPTLIELAEGKPIYIETTINEDFKISPQQLENAITDKTKAFIFSSPCNPSGSVYTRDELFELAKVFARHPHVLIISDEIYEHINFAFKHVSIAEFDIVKNQVVVINGVSKSFAMPGWRIGYMAAPLHIAAACNKIQGQLTSAPSSIAQRAALKAIETDPSDIKELKIMCEAFKERRDIALEMLSKIEGLKLNNPKGAFYIFMDVSYYFGKTDGETVINDDNDLCLYLLNKAHIALVAGSAFGNPNCIRISYANSKEKIIEAINRLKKALEKLK